jgi:hypothetical protein
MQRTALLALMLVGCAGSTSQTSTRAAAPAAPRPPAWQDEARRDAVVHGTGEMTGHPLATVGVIDVDGDRVFVQGADQKIDALALATGQVVFETDVSGVPIGFLPGNVVLVFATDTRLRLLDHDNGAVLFTSDPAPAIGSNAIVFMEYAGGKFRVESAHTESAGYACCAGGPQTTYEATATIDLSTGEVAATQSMYQGELRHPPRDTHLRTSKPLPPTIHVQLPVGPSKVASDGSVTAKRSLSITVDGNPPWTYALSPIHYPKLDNRQKAPRQ